MRSRSEIAEVERWSPKATVGDQKRALFDYRKYWAECFGSAPFLPTSRAEMDLLGWDSCDVILVSGDAYVDHPSFGAAIIGRLLEAQGFRVGILAQPDWKDVEAFRELGEPNLYFGITGGNMDSLVNHYTSDKKKRNDDAYTAAAEAGKRPDRAVIVYSQKCREAYRDAPIVLGGIEASLRRIAHYDYWSNQIRRSILVDTQADILLYGNAERSVVELTHRIAEGQAVSDIRDIRGTAFLVKDVPQHLVEIDSTELDTPGVVEEPKDPYAMSEDETQTEKGCKTGPGASLVPLRVKRAPRVPREQTYIRLPSFESVVADKVLYAHTSRVLHLEANPGNARALVQSHGNQHLWLNPPPIPLQMQEMDQLYELPYQRVPHPRYQENKVPAYEMIRFSITIQRGCFGGCSFCSITEHEGRIIQNRSEESILQEIEKVRDLTPGFTGVISDLGGPTANMYRLACKSAEVEAACRRPSCVFPGVCSNLQTNHKHLISLYRKAREIPGIKKILIASGVRYDLAVEDPEYVKELVTHHVGGYLKIAPEHVADGPLKKMMKPGMGSYERFKELFTRYSEQAGKKQFLIPYFIAAHPGTTDYDMLELALWLKRNGFKADQVQAYLPSPMSSATAMYHSGKNPLGGVRRDSEDVYIPKSYEQRKLHKAFLRYHDPSNWPILREALKKMGQARLIGNGPQYLVPATQGFADGSRGPKRLGQGGTKPEGTRSSPGSKFKTQHTRRGR